MWFRKPKYCHVKMHRYLLIYVTGISLKCKLISHDIIKIILKITMQQWNYLSIYYKTILISFIIGKKLYSNLQYTILL